MSAPCDKLKCWRNWRGSKEMLLIALADFSYVVVLAPAKKHCVLVSAYSVEHDRRRDSFRKEHEEYLVKKAAAKD